MSNGSPSFKNAPAPLESIRLQARIPSSSQLQIDHKQSSEAYVFAGHLEQEQREAERNDSPETTKEMPEEHQPPKDLLLFIRARDMRRLMHMMRMENGLFESDKLEQIRELRRENYEQSTRQFSNMLAASNSRVTEPYVRGSMMPDLCVGDKLAIQH